MEVVKELLENSAYIEHRDMVGAKPHGKCSLKALRCFACSIKMFVFTSKVATAALFLVVFVIVYCCCFVFFCVFFYVQYFC